MKLEVLCKNLQDTQKFATGFAKILRAPTIVLLKGDLGAGKTTFVKDVAVALGFDGDVVTSPTFTLMNTYTCAKKQGCAPIYHFDMYRLSGAEEAQAAGFAEYFDKSTLDGIVFVEWPENVEGFIWQWDFEVEITKMGENARKIVICGGEA